MSSVQVYDQNGNKTEEFSIALAEGVQDISAKAYTQAIRVLTQNWRQGTVGVKGRSDVSFTNKKPWRQKGTGRARASSARSPLWRSGGVTFGPQPRTRELSVNRRQRKQVLSALFASFVESGKVSCLDLSFEKPSTRMASSALKSAGCLSGKVLLFSSFDDDAVRASFCNLPNVCVASFDQPNAYICASASQWVFLKKDLEHFKRMVEQWS
jgi:large subunit ribosomal protein L4